MANPLYLLMGTLIIQGFHLGSTQEYCGQKEPNSDKLCVSLRLPWQEQPVYFCTDKDKINYRKKCKGSAQYCPPQPDETLQISTPWDCCPLTSQPNPCANAKCPPAPFNRTCTQYWTDNFWECCPHYYCDEEGDREMCHIKKLEPGCTSHPKDKLNCTGFIDPHGCCNKWQCHQDEKSGECPSTLRQQTVGTSVGVTTTTSSSINHTRTNGPYYFGSLTPATTYSVVSFGALEQCTSDYTCTGKKKCCPLTNYGYSNLNAVRFGPTSTERRAYSSQSNKGNDHIENIVHGYCMEPIVERKV